MKSKKVILKESVKHYSKMIKWVKKQDQNLSLDSKKMYKEIKKDWSNTYCPCCQNYNIATHFLYRCRLDCPMIINRKRCISLGHPWNKMFYSVTWGEWLIHANKMLDLIKKRLKECIKWKMKI
jgi:hypothetical protein